MITVYGSILPEAWRFIQEEQERESVGTLQERQGYESCWGLLVGRKWLNLGYHAICLGSFRVGVELFYIITSKSSEFAEHLSGSIKLCVEVVCF